MRGAATCDIHDNLPALEMVHHRIGQSGADHAVVGGELASAPTSPETLTGLLESRFSVQFIPGSCEVAVLAEMRKHPRVA
jgi:hypothetical protein